MKPRVIIHTDGACSPNPGIGGWAAVLIFQDEGGRRVELSEGVLPDTTNQRMEQLAAIQGLRVLKLPSEVTLFTDSIYVCGAFTKGWIKNWQRNGWRNAARKPVDNQDLWRDLIELTNIHTVGWHWVRGHADNEENNRCDELAVAAREAVRERLATRAIR